MGLWHRWTNLKNNEDNHEQECEWFENSCLEEVTVSVSLAILIILAICVIRS